MEAPEPGPCLSPARKLWPPARVRSCLGLSAVRSGAWAAPAGDPRVTVPQNSEGVPEPGAIAGPRRPCPAGVAEADSVGVARLAAGGAGPWGPRWPPESQVSGAASARVYVTRTVYGHACVWGAGVCTCPHTRGGGPCAPQGSCRLRGPGGCRAVALGPRRGAALQPPGRAHREPAARAPLQPPPRRPRVLPHLPSPVLPLRPHSSSRPSHPSLHLAPRPPGLLCAPLSVGWWDELRSGSWISFPGDPRPPRGPESPLRTCLGRGCLGRGCPGWGAALKGPQLRHSAQTGPQVEKPFIREEGSLWRGPGWGVSNSGSRGWPLGEGGSGQQRGARCEACVRKGAPTRLPARQPAQGWAAGCRRSQAGCGEGAGVGRGWEVRPPPGAASGQQGELGTWLILAGPPWPWPCRQSSRGSY